MAKTQPPAVGLACFSDLRVALEARRTIYAGGKLSLAIIPDARLPQQSFNVVAPLNRQRR
jgi:hypothetical protein